MKLLWSRELLQIESARQRSQSGAKIDLKQDVFSCSTVLRSSRFQYKLNQEGESENKGNDEKWVQNKTGDGEREIGKEPEPKWASRSWRMSVLTQRIWAGILEQK
jgi:hypothetical protein